jgi:hypothetical protein
VFRQWKSLLATALVAFAVVAYLHWRPQPSVPSAINVDGTRVAVQNGSPDDWHDVKITVNAYYRGGLPQLPARGRVEGEVSNLETGLGHRFDPARERVTSVEVTAVDAAGRPILLKWTR